MGIKLNGGCLVVLTFFCVVFGENQNIEVTPQDTLQVKGRELQEDWRILIDSPPHSIRRWMEETSLEDDSLATQRRRRIRKRKRRPQIKSTTESKIISISETVTEKPKKIRPNRLDQIDDPWLNFSEDFLDSPHSRRKTIPNYEEDTSSTISPSVENRIQMENFGFRDAVSVGQVKSYQKVRDPFTALEEEEKQKKRRKGTADIKNILKKTGSLSLSEILQKKNLSLSDLLMGKEQAISALTDPTIIGDDEPIKEYINPVKDPKYTPSTQTLTTMLLSTTESVLKNTPKLSNFMPKNQSRFVQRERFKPFKASTDSYTLIKDQKKNVSHKYKTYSTSGNSEINNQIKKNSRFNIKPVILNKSEKTVSETTTSVINTTVQSVTSESEEGPIKMSINLHDFNKTDDAVRSDDVTDLPNKLQPSSAKEEILEIMNDPEGKERLSRILRLKNMTLNDLIELRERGSSKKHLADLFHNKNKEPEPPKEPLEGTMKISQLERKPKFLEEIEASNTTNDVTTLTAIDLIVNDTSTTEYDHEEVMWMNILTKMVTEKDKSFIGPKNIQDILENDVRRMDTEEKKITDPLLDHIQIDFEESTENENPKPSNTAPKIFSAVLASFSILGVSLLVFLTILFVFKFSRHKRNHQSIMNHFDEYKSKYPILEGSFRKTIKSIVPEKLPRRLRDPVSCKNPVPEGEYNGKPYESIKDFY